MALADGAIDLKLTYDATGDYYDLTITNGQFDTVTNFDTALNMIMFAERRADESEIPVAEYRRGWWGNEILHEDDPDFEIGSKVWLLEQARATDQTLAELIDYVKQASEWLITDGHVSEVEVTGSYTSSTTARIQIDLIIFSNKVESRYFDLWLNTGA